MFAEDSKCWGDRKKEPRLGGEGERKGGGTERKGRKRGSRDRELGPGERINVCTE